MQHGFVRVSTVFMSMVSLLKFSSHEKVRSTIHFLGMGTNLSVRLSDLSTTSRSQCSGGCRRSLPASPRSSTC